MKNARTVNIRRIPKGIELPSMVILPYPDISQMTSKFVENIPQSQYQGGLYAICSHPMA